VATTTTTLYTAKTGTGDSAIAARRDGTTTGGAVVVANVGTGSPTFTYTIQGSVDGTNYFNIPYALVATPSTFVVAPITTTTTNTITYLLQANQPWNFVKLNISALTTETVDAIAYL
jgi:hypothetical protein